MNETHWENAKKSHRKLLQFILFTGLPIFILAGIIICNNNDLFSGKKNAKEKNVIVSDSEIVFFPPADSEEDKFLDSSSVSSVKPQNVQSIGLKSEHINKKQLETEKKEKIIQNQIYQKGELNEIKGVIKSQIDDRKSNTDSSEKAKIDKKLHNIETSQQYSFLLSNVQSRVIDRKDIFISLALELFYDDTSDNREILIRRDALKVVVKKVIQTKELNSIKKDMLSEELKNEMNSIFDRKTLINVRIREFHIEKVDAQ